MYSRRKTIYASIYSTRLRKQLYFRLFTPFSAQENKQCWNF